MRIGDFADGRSLEWDAGTSGLTVDGQPVTPVQASEYERDGQLTLISEEWRDWLYRFAGEMPSGPAVTPDVPVTSKSTKVTLRRGAAFVVDGLFTTVVLMPLFMLLYWASPSEGFYDVVAYPLNFVALAGYRIVSDARFGRTIGKLPFGIRVVSREGGRITYKQAALRFVGGFVDLLVFAIPAIVSMNRTPLHQRIGDRLADTYVVRSTLKSRGA